MDSRYMQEAVEIELAQSNKGYELKDKLQSREIFYFLTRAERDYVQEIYNSGVDKSEENKKKLGALLLTTEITGGDITLSTFYPSSYIVSIPTDCLYVTNERVDLVGYTNVFVKPTSFDEYSINKNNPFRKSTIDKCLRLEGNIQHILITPDIAVETVYLDYIKTPLGIDIMQDCELHESVHYNIVKGAVKLILGAKQDQVGYSIQSKEEKENK